MVFVGKKGRLFTKTLWTELSAWARDTAQDVLRYSRTKSIPQSLHELNALPDHQLSDIGLSRSDLTPNGLRTAGTRRTAQQRAVSSDIARIENKTKAKGHGD
ncbi:MAG: DUF1127 domain-containing protein [Pseudomonadota bacterium]